MYSFDDSDDNLKVYPLPKVDENSLFGALPVDFILEKFLEDGLHWYRTTPEAPRLVYGNLMRGSLADKYGQAKIDEITRFIKETPIEIMQSFPMADVSTPCISINLQSSQEIPNYQGIGHHAGEEDDFDSDGNVVGRKEIGYHPVRDSVLVGIHGSGSPDKVKYLYYLLVYLFAAGHDDLERKDTTGNNLFGLSISATDLSRLNEYLPDNMFSRFMTVTVDSIALIRKGSVPIVDTFKVKVGFE